MQDARVRRALTLVWERLRAQAPAEFGQRRGSGARCPWSLKDDDEATGETSGGGGGGGGGSGSGGSGGSGDGGGGGSGSSGEGGDGWAKLEAALTVPASTVRCLCLMEVGSSCNWVAAIAQRYVPPTAVSGAPKLVRVSTGIASDSAPAGGGAPSTTMYVAWGSALLRPAA
jgi:hypothetical protein